MSKLLMKKRIHRRLRAIRLEQVEDFVRRDTKRIAGRIAKVLALKSPWLRVMERKYAENRRHHLWWAWNFRKKNGRIFTIVCWARRLRVLDKRHRLENMDYLLRTMEETPHWKPNAYRLFLELIDRRL